MESKIDNPAMAKQLIDFAGLDIDGYIYPTDIDGLIEYKDSEYIIFEIKCGDTEIPIGQRVALQRMVDDFTKVGKQAIVFVCENMVHDMDAPVIAANCIVREIYYGDKGEWRKPLNEFTVRDAVDMFQKHSMEVKRRTHNWRL